MLCRDLLGCENGTIVESTFCLRNKTELRAHRGGGYMFNGELSDKTGFINFVYWGGADQDSVKEIFDPLSVDNIIKIKGTLGTYNERRQISIDQKIEDNYIRNAEEAEIDVSKFLPETNQDIDGMWGYLEEVIESVENPHLKELLNKFSDDEEFMRLFKTLPGARVYHHACKGGLLEHIWETMQYCEIVIDVHESLDRDLVIAGAFLHDIGKIKENKMNVNITETREGMLLGHIFLGANMVKEKITEIADFPELLEHKLMHIILSHHGKVESGAFIEPMTAEAAAVSTADAMGSLVTQYIRARKDSANGDFKTYKRPIGWVFRE
ncbi:MAG: 3'-5' exoribonuclease YhaM family protein [Candidatus Odinarchaeia archaeon]